MKSKEKVMKKLEQLMIAAIIGDEIKKVKQILDRGYPVNYTSTGETFLMMAIELGYTYITNLLLEYGADVNHFYKDAYQSKTPLSLACSTNITPIVKVLLDNGADMSMKISQYSFDEEKYIFENCKSFKEKHIQEIVFEKHGYIVSEFIKFFDISNELKEKYDYIIDGCDLGLL